MSAPSRDVSRQNPPTPERLAEIEAGIVEPTPYERDYLAQNAASQETASSGEDAQGDGKKPKYVREELTVSEAERGPWYNPHPGSMDNAKRAVKPAVIVNSIYLVVTTSAIFLPGGREAFAPLGIGAILAIITLTLGISIAVMLWAARGSIIAHYLVLAGNYQSVSRTIDLFREGDWVSGLAAGAILVAVLSFWMISLSALLRYDRYRKGKLEL